MYDIYSCKKGDILNVAGLWLRNCMGNLEYNETFFSVHFAGYLFRAPLGRINSFLISKLCS